MTDEDQPRPLAPPADRGPTPQRATDRGAGRIVAAIVVLALAFGAGLIVGQSRPGAVSPASSASPVAVAATMAAPASSPPGDGAPRRPAAVDAADQTASPAGQNVRAGGGRRDERVTPSPKATRDDSDRRSGKGDRRRGGGGDEDDDD